MTIHPETPPDPTLSMTGRRIVDLLKHDMTLRQIARHVGCAPSQIHALRTIPSSSASRTLIVALETLHENVITGKSRWGRMVEALVAHGWTYEQLAVRAGVSANYLKNEFGHPLKIPTNGVAEVIEGLYCRHVRDLVRNL